MSNSTATSSQGPAATRFVPLIGVAFTDFYVRLVATGAFADPRLF